MKRIDQAILASLRVGKAHPDVRRMDQGQQYLYLAAHLSIHDRSELDGEGVTPELFVRRITECFGYEGQDLRRFKRGLRESGLFVTNEKRGANCRYSVVPRPELRDFLECYQSFETEANELAKLSESSYKEPNPNKWANAEAAAQHVVDTDPPPPSLPVDVKDRVLAVMLAKEFMNTPLDDDGHTLKDDPALLHQVSQAMLVEFWNLK